MAFSFKGPGVVRELEAWFGYAQVWVRGEDGAPERALIRIARVDDLKAYDARMKLEREARRKGGVAAPEPHPWLVLEKEGVNAPLKLVATGLDASEHLEHLAAWLKVNHG
jgi:hypothetical protein